MKIFLIPFILIFFFVALNSKAQAPDEIIKYYFVDLITNPDRLELPKAEADSIQTAHLKNIGMLHEQGKLMLAGPFENGGGILILNVDSKEDAEEIAKNDPAVAAGRLLVKIRAWYTGKGVFVNESIN